MNQKQTDITTGKQIRHLRTQSGMTQEEVINSLAEWIHNKAFMNVEKGLLACRIVVCFFIQNCEVFYR